MTRAPTILANYGATGNTVAVSLEEIEPTCAERLDTYLDGKDRDTAGSLGQDPITRKQGLQPEQSVPGGQPGTRQRGSFNKVEVGRKGDETVLVEGSVLLKSSIDNSTSPSGDDVIIGRSREMSLVEERDDLVPCLESVDLRPDGFDGSSAVRGGYDLVSLGEGVLTLKIPATRRPCQNRWIRLSPCESNYLGDDEVSIVQRCSVN